MSILESLRWRYATKKFDATKKLTKDQLDLLLEATNLSATSLGLQPFQILVVENSSLREKLKAAAWNQPQITDASHLVIFAAKTNLSSVDVDLYMQLISKKRGISVEALADFKGMVDGAINGRLVEALTQWAARQAYIALGTLLTTAAFESIDACPMEGFDNAQFDEILGLKEKHLTAVVIAAIGVRSNDDKYQHLIKVRREISDIVTVIK